MVENFNDVVTCALNFTSERYIFVYTSKNNLGKTSFPPLN